MGSGSDNVDNDGTDAVVVDDNKRSDDRRRTGRGEESVELGFRFFTCSSFFSSGGGLTCCSGSSVVTVTE